MQDFHTKLTRLLILFHVLRLHKSARCSTEKGNAGFSKRVASSQLNSVALLDFWVDLSQKT